MEATPTSSVLSATRIVRPEGRDTALRLRVADARDVESVGQFLRGLPPDARYRRFHAGVAGVSDRVVGRLLHAKPPFRQALVLEHGRAGRHTVVGLAQLAKESETTAEVALVVDGAWQRMGLGVTMLDALTELAARHYRTLSAYVQPDDAAVLGLLRAAAGGMVAEYQGPVVRLTWPARPAAARRVAAA